MTDDAPAAALADMQRRFVARCEEDLQRLRAHENTEALAPEALRLIVHRLAGLAGVFDHAPLGEVAAKVDDELVASPNELPQSWSELLSALHAVATQNTSEGC